MKLQGACSNPVCLRTSVWTDAHSDEEGLKVKPCWTPGPKLACPVGAGFLRMGGRGLKMLKGRRETTAHCSLQLRLTVVGREEKVLTQPSDQEPCYASQWAHLIPPNMTAGLLLVTALLAREKGSKKDSPSELANGELTAHEQLKC